MSHSPSLNSVPPRRSTLSHLAAQLYPPPQRYQVSKLREAQPCFVRAVPEACSPGAKSITRRRRTVDGNTRLAVHDHGRCATMMDHAWPQAGSETLTARSHLCPLPETLPVYPPVWAVALLQPRVALCEVAVAEEATAGTEGTGVGGFEHEVAFLKVSFGRFPQLAAAECGLRRRRAYRIQASDHLLGMRTPCHQHDPVCRPGRAVLCTALYWRHGNARGRSC